MNSILFTNTQAQKIRTYSVSELIRAWDKTYGIDTKRFFEGQSEVHEYQCLRSGLYFYTPATLAGDCAFYNDLMAQPWYYLADKWEFETALKLLRPDMNILEIGSGSGAFIEKCCAKEIHATGLELNAAAVKVARAKGLTVIRENLMDFEPTHKGVFDAVVSFQVLEHIAEPLPFLEACIGCLKPGGILLISVPNADLPLVRRHNILNCPPHHMLGWTARSFRALEELLPLQLQQILIEPLAQIHIDWYLGITQQTNFIFRQWLRWPVLNNFAKMILRKGMRKWIKGHSLLVWYKKASS